MSSCTSTDHGGQANFNHINGQQNYKDKVNSSGSVSRNKTCLWLKCPANDSSGQFPPLMRLLIRKRSNCSSPTLWQAAATCHENYTSTQTCDPNRIVDIHPHHGDDLHAEPPKKSTTPLLTRNFSLSSLQRSPVQNHPSPGHHLLERPEVCTKAVRDIGIIVLHFV